MHFLQPDSDDEVEQKKKQQSSSPQQETTKKSNKVKIEVESDDDEEEVPINKNKNKSVVAAPQQQEEISSKSNAVEQQQQQQASTPKLSGPNNDQYYFKYLSERKPFPFQGGDKELTTLISKWGLGESMSCLQFSYEMITDSDTYANSKSATVQGQVHAALLPEFIVALLNSDEFLKHFKCGDGHGNGGNKNSVSVSYPSPVSAVKLQILRAKETTLDLFDRLVAPSRDITDPEERNKKLHPRMRDIPTQIVRDNGHVCNMADVFLPCGITVSDQLRGLFMLSEEENPECYEIFSEEERNEFLWHVMWRLLAGGAVNQYEDEFEPYKDACREVYKSLISVGRSNNNAKKQQQTSGDDDAESTGANASTQPSLEVQSLVAQVKDIKCKNKSIMKTTFFPKDDKTGNHNFFYVIVDPFRKTCIVWYNAFFSPF